MAHNYSNTASKAVLDAPLNSSSTTFAVTSFTGYPSAPFWVLMDRDTSSAELMEVTSVAGSTLTVIRGAGGTASTSHSAGATVEHVIPALVPQQSEQHIEATSNIHGVTGTLIGSDSTGTLANKTFQGAFVHNYSNSEPGSPAGGFVVNADNSVGRDGFILNNTGANNDRAGFVLRQAGSDRFKVYNDGTVSVNPSGASTRAAIATSGTVQAEDVEATDDITAGGDITATGTVTGAAGNFGTLNLSGNLASTGNNTLGTVTAAGVVTASAPGTALVVSNTAQVGSLNVNSGNVVLSAAGAKLQFPASVPSPTAAGSAEGQTRYLNGALEVWNGSAWHSAGVIYGASGPGAASGVFTGNNTVAARSITGPSSNMPYRVMVMGQGEVNNVPANVRYDIVVRLDDANSGTIIATGLGDFVATGTGNKLVQTATAFTDVLIGNHTIYFRLERTVGASGSATLTSFNQFWTAMVFGSND